MHVTPMVPVGATVTDFVVGAVDDRTADVLRDLLAEHGVLVIPDQDIDDETFEAFLRSFGELVFTVGETPLEGHADLNVITNVGRTTTPRSQFHVDTSYVPRPPAYTALRAVTVPEQGGQTLFTNQYRAFETLQDDVRERHEGRTVTHVVTGVDPGEQQETSADHPLFRRHPRSGRTSIYLSTPDRCTSVSGLADAEAADTVRVLLDHSTTAENTLRHSWSPGDVVIWDNGCVMHKADHDGVVGDRVMHRGMVDGYGTETAAWAG